MNSLVSIVVATYNRKDSLKKTLQSILLQTHSNIEVIVVDDGSTDDTRSVIESLHDPRIRFFQNERNRGATYSRNKGLDFIKGDFFLVWDSDDILYPNALERILTVFSANPLYTTVSASTRVYQNGLEVSYKPIKEGILPFEDIACVTYVKYKILRVSRTSSCGHVRYKARNLDFMFNTYVAKHGQWFHLGEYLGEHFLTSDKVSLTLSRRKPNIAYSIERAQPLADYLSEFGDIMKRRNPSRYADYAYGASLGFLVGGDVKNARKYANEAAKHSEKLQYTLLHALTYIPCAPSFLRMSFKLRRAYLNLR